MPAFKKLSILTTLLLLAGGLNLAPSARAGIQKPADVAEEFFRLIKDKNYEAAYDLLSTPDKKNFRALSTKTGRPEAEIAGGILADYFFLLHGQENQKMVKKAKSGETIMPERVGFFVPGQNYIEGKYAVVFTRETYDITHANTGPVRDDPRKLWIDPTNALSQVRDEAYFKQWWVWEGDRLTMPGLLWLVRERNKWKVDLISGCVPRKAFYKILRWHFGRDVLEEKKPAAKPGQPASPQPPRAAAPKEPGR